MRFPTPRTLPILACLLASGCATVRHVDSVVSLAINARAHTIAGARLDDVQIDFRDVGLDEHWGGKGVQKSIGRTDAEGQFTGTYFYSWGNTYRNGRLERSAATRARTFELVFTKSGFEQSVRLFDLDSLPGTGAERKIDVDVELLPRREG